LAAYPFYEFNTNRIYFGNPNLNRALIHNYDIKLEWYPVEGTALSINGFQKYFMSPIEPYLSSGFSFPITTYRNLKGANMQGLELEGRTSLGWIDAVAGTNWLNRIAFFGNYTWLKTKVYEGDVANTEQYRPLVGQSPYIFNAGGRFSWEEKKLDFQITANTFGDRVIYSADYVYQTVWERPRWVIDMSITKRFGNHLQARITVGDLLNPTILYYQDRNANQKYDKDVDVKWLEQRVGYTLGFNLQYQF
jgi:outer membrane receptor protein involved in Fe transport